MLQFLWWSYNVPKRNIQGRLNGRISSNIAYGKLVITGFVSVGIEYIHKSSSYFTLRMNQLFLFIMHVIPKRLPKMIFVYSIMHGSRSGNMGSKIIPAVDIVAFGDAIDWLMSAMNRGSFG